MVACLCANLQTHVCGSLPPQTIPIKLHQHAINIIMSSIVHQMKMDVCIVSASLFYYSIIPI